MRIWGKDMKNKFLIGVSTVAVVVLVLASLSPVVGYNSVESSAKESPLFNVRTKRAINQEQEDITYKYIGMGKTFSIPQRNNQTEIVMRVIDAISKMDEETFNKFVGLFITRISQYTIFKNEIIEEMVRVIRLFRTKPAILRDIVISNSDDDTSQFVSCRWFRGCFIYNVFVLIGVIGIVFLVLGIMFTQYLIYVTRGMLTLSEDCFTNQPGC